MRWAEGRGRVLPLQRDPLKAHFGRCAKHGRAIRFDVLVEAQVRARPALAATPNVALRVSSGSRRSSPPSSSISSAACRLGLSIGSGVIRWTENRQGPHSRFRRDLERPSSRARHRRPPPLQRSRRCSRSGRRMFDRLPSLDPCIDPTQKRSYFLKSCLLQMLSSNGGRFLIRARAVHDDLQFARIGRYHRIDVLWVRGHGAGMIPDCVRASFGRTSRIRSFWPSSINPRSSSTLIRSMRS